MIPHTDRFKLLADELLVEQRDRPRVLFHSFACEVTTKGDRIDAVGIANKAGLVQWCSARRMLLGLLFALEHGSSRRRAVVRRVARCRCGLLAVAESL